LAEDEVLQQDFAAKAADDVLVTDSYPGETDSTGPLALGQKRSWWTRLRDGLSRSSGSIGEGLELAAQFKADDMSVVLVAGDTFRAAAIEQLRILGERSHCPVIAHEQGSDASALAFDGGLIRIMRRELHPKYLAHRGRVTRALSSTGWRVAHQ
jgi:SRP54-type protein, GTPase domain